MSPRLLLALVLLACANSINSCAPARADILACMDATCRIEAAGGMGTGTVFDADENYAYLLTNAHVAQGEGTQLRCVFVRDGFEQVVRGSTRWSVMESQRDCAVVIVPVSEFGGNVPKPIPFDPTATPVRGQAIMSVGCAQGANPTAWIGHVQDANEWSMHFYPPPHRGRSGSAVFDKDGTRIVGLITWNNNAGSGIAQRSDAVSQAFARRFPTEAVPVCSGPSSGRGAAPTGRFLTQGGGSSPTRRVPIDELEPIAPLVPVPRENIVPTPIEPAKPDFDEDALVRRIEQLIDEKLAALPKPEPGPAGPAGPQGPAGPAGRDGVAGAPAIDYAELAKHCPPSLTADQIAAIVRAELSKDKPDLAAERPAAEPGYYDVRRRKKD